MESNGEAGWLMNTFSLWRWEKVIDKEWREFEERRGVAEGTVQLAEWLFTDLLTRNELDTYILIKVAAPCLHSYR